MKTKMFISLALLTMFSGTALSHQIYYAECDDSVSAEAAKSAFVTRKSSPVSSGGLGGIMGQSGRVNAPDVVECYSDQPEMQELRGEHPNTPESDRVAAMTFCKMGGYTNTADCASDVLNKGLADEARACIDSADVHINKTKMNKFSHQLGGNGSDSGVWHKGYAYNKEDGWHRHDWTKEARDGAGNAYAAAQIDHLKKEHAVVSISTSNTTITSGSVGVGGAVSTGVGIAGVEINGNAGVSGGSEKGTSVEKGPIDAATLRKKWAEYYKIGYDDPQLTGLNPNVFCARSEPECVASSGQVIKNTSYQPNAPKTNGSKKTDSSSSPSPTHKSSENDSHKTPASSSKDDFGHGEGIKVSDGGHWAGDPSKPADGSMWVDFGQQDPSKDPMALCMFNANNERVKDGSNKTYDTNGAADRRSKAEKKRDAEALLKKGICNESYYGREYCTHWKMKFHLIDSNETSKEKPIVAPGEKVERPGYLHFDPNRAPVKVPSLDGKVTNPNPPKLPSLKP